MSSILASNGMVLVTAMAAAVSGTVILLAFRVQKSLPTTTNTQFSIDPIDDLQPPQSNSPRPCLSSEGKKREKNKKRVHFAEDVMEPTGNGEEFRRQHRKNLHNRGNGNGKKLAGGEIPANRMALYSGILRDRVVHRVGYSY